MTDEKLRIQFIRFQTLIFSDPSNIEKLLKISRSVGHLVYFSGAHCEFLIFKMIFY